MIYDYYGWCDGVPVYESWIVDECMERIKLCEDMTEQEINDYLDEHPEYSIRCLPNYL